MKYLLTILLFLTGCHDSRVIGGWANDEFEDIFNPDGTYHTVYHRFSDHKNHDNDNWNTNFWQNQLIITFPNKSDETSSSFIYEYKIDGEFLVLKLLMIKECDKNHNCSIYDYSKNKRMAEVRYHKQYSIE